MRAYKYFLFFFVAGTFCSFSQVSYSNKVQESALNKDSYKLFFVDFWATWCGPCSYATTHINQIRDRFPNDLYVATISQEQPGLIEKYLKKHPNTLDVYSDASGDTFKSYNIKVLPNGILFNSKGDILWQGSPSDFSVGILSRFLRNNKREAKVSKLFHFVKNENQTAKEYVPKKDFEIFAVDNMIVDGLEIQRKDNYTKINGSLDAILAYSNNIIKSQVVIQEANFYSVYIKNDLVPFLENLILNHLKLKRTIRKKEVESFVYNLKSSKLWDSNQINWTNNNDSKYLITDSDIEADNLTVNEFFTIIASQLNVPFIIEGNYDKKKKHDWQLHYEYFELMSPSLNDDFGIKVTKEKRKIPHYYITKKSS